MLGRKKAEPKTPHFLSLDQDIVGSPQDEKCELKYDMWTFWGPARTLDHDDLTNKDKGISDPALFKIN